MLTGFFGSGRGYPHRFVRVTGRLVPAWTAGDNGDVSSSPVLPRSPKAASRTNICRLLRWTPAIETAFRSDGRKPKTSSPTHIPRGPQRRRGRDDNGLESRKKNGRPRKAK